MSSVRTKSGISGSSIDMGNAERIAFLVKLSERYKSVQLLDVTSRAVEHLVTGWTRAVPEFYELTGLLKKLKSYGWFISHGGRALYRKLLDGVLDNMTFANASDWVELVSLSNTALGWTDADQVVFDRELAEYCDKGVNEERTNCDTEEQLTAMIQSLPELGRKIGVDFSYQMGRLEEALNEFGPSQEELSEGEGIPRSSAVFPSQEVTDNDVRQMFNTLKS